LSAFQTFWAAVLMTHPKEVHLRAGLYTIALRRIVQCRSR
jgi:hypothetical protein